LTYGPKEAISNVKPVISITELFALEIVVPEMLMPLPLHDGAAAGRDLAVEHMRRGEFSIHVDGWRHFITNTVRTGLAIA
jgi:hypothetical protein